MEVLALYIRNVVLHVKVVWASRVLQVTSRVTKPWVFGVNESHGFQLE